MDSPASIRRRQVDVDKPLQIIWIEKDDPQSQALALEQALPPLPSHTNKLRHSINGTIPEPNGKTDFTTLTKSDGPLSPRGGEVATPKIRPLNSTTFFSTEEAPQEPFKRPHSYIHFSEPPYDFDARSYQMDDQDDDFLILWNESVHGEEDLSLTEDRLEDFFTLFENLSYLHRTAVQDISPSEDPVLAGGSRDATFREERRALSQSIEKTVFSKRTTRPALHRLEEELLNLQGLQCDGCNACRGASAVQDEQFLRCAECRVVCHRSCYYEGIEETPPLSPSSQEDEGTTISLSAVRVQRNWVCHPCSLAATAMDEDEDYEPSSPAATSSPTERQCALCLRHGGLLRQDTRARSKTSTPSPEPSTSEPSFTHLICSWWTENIPQEGLEDDKLSLLRSVRPFRWDSECKKCGERGVCIQCTASHCRNLYHPSCAQAAHCYMDPKAGLFYCVKHTREQAEQSDNYLKSSATLSWTQLEALMPIVKQHAQEFYEKGDPVPPVLLESVFYYWKCKRMREQSYLISRLNVMVEEEQEVSERRKRGKKHRVDENVSLHRIIQIRKDLEKARILLDMVRKREVLKMEWIEQSRRLVQLRFCQTLPASKRRISYHPFLPEDEEENDDHQSPPSEEVLLELSPISSPSQGEEPEPVRVSKRRRSGHRSLSPAREEEENDDFNPLHQSTGSLRTRKRRASPSTRSSPTPSPKKARHSPPPRRSTRRTRGKRR